MQNGSSHRLSFVILVWFLRNEFGTSAKSFYKTLHSCFYFSLFHLWKALFFPTPPPRAPLPVPHSSLSQTIMLMYVYSNFKIENWWKTGKKNFFKAVLLWYFRLWKRETKQTCYTLKIYCLIMIIYSFFFKIWNNRLIFSGWEGEDWFGEGKDGVKHTKKNQFANIC